MILLDTHVLLWLLEDSPRLSTAGRARLQASTAVYVSAVTHAELRIKEMIGKLRLPGDWSARLADQGLRPLPFTQAHADELPALVELARHDPFDRMLLAQARSEGLSFLTADRRLLALELPWVLDAG